MPMFAEVGPLVLDPLTRDSVDAYIALTDSSRPPFLVTLDKTHPSLDTKPHGKLNLHLHPTTLTLPDLHLSYPLAHLSLTLPKHEHNQVILTTSPESKLTLRFKDNLERDLFTLAFRVLRDRAEASSPS